MIIRYIVSKGPKYRKELFNLFAASAFRKLSSIYVFSYFPFGFAGRIWDLTVSVPDHCLSFYFPSRIDFKKCREEIASALNDFGNRWCKREYVEPDALKEWKVSIFKIVDQRIKFYSQNTNLLPPKPKSTFRHLKQGILHRKYVLVPADKVANNVVVVCRSHYINTLKQELSGTKAYKETFEEEKSVATI